MFLLDMCVQGGVTQISLRAVTTFKVSALDIVLTSAFALAPSIAIIATIVIVSVLTLRLRGNILHRVTPSCHVLRRTGSVLSVCHLPILGSHHELGILTVAHVSHLHHLVGSGAIAIGCTGIGLVDSCLVVEHTTLAVARHHGHLLLLLLLLLVDIVEILAPLSRQHSLVAKLLGFGGLNVQLVCVLLLLSVHLLSKSSLRRFDPL